MKVAVTGASGFLGQTIVEELAGKGHEVLAISRRASGLPTGARRLVVEEYEDLPSAEVLVHLAEQSSVQVAEQSGDQHLAHTVRRTLGLAKSGRFARILYASSGAVYGDLSSHPHRPQEVPAGTSIYARTKIECERAVLGAGGVALRLGNVIGANMSPSAVLARVLAQIPGSGDLLLRDDSAVRDFVWIGDVASCVAAFVAAPVVGPFNVGSGEAISVRRLAETALAVAGEAHRAVVSETRAPHASQLSLDIADTTRAVAWKPRMRLDAAIAKILESRHV